MSGTDRPSTIKKTAKIVLPFVALIAGVMVVQVLMATAPEPQKAPERPSGPLVKVEAAQTVTERVIVEAVGRVRPSRTGALQPEVPGRVVEVHPGLVKGGALKEGELAFRIDPVDYELQVRQARARVAQARHEVKVEAGRSTVARREWKLLDQEIDTTDAGRALALREPHKELAEANLAAASAELARAQRQVDKTSVLVPFNAYVKEETVETGLLASAGAQLAQIIGTDVFWVEAAIPVSQLDWFAVPGQGGVPADGGAAVTVVTKGPRGEEHSYEGQVVRLLSELDELGVQARILVAVADPLRLDAPGLPLFVDAFAQLRIEGREVPDVVAIPTVAMDGDAHAWVVTGAGKLERRPLSVVWRGRERVLVDGGVSAGDRLVVSPLSNPVPGMKVRVEGDPSPSPPADEPEPDGAAAVGRGPAKEAP